MSFHVCATLPGGRLGPVVVARKIKVALVPPNRSYSTSPVAARLVQPLERDRHTFGAFIEVLDVGRSGDKVRLHHSSE